MLRNKSLRLHFIGIGGIGMSGIAELLLNQGYRISGSDAADSELLQRLRSLGAKVSIGHAATNVHETDVIVVSSAIRPENPEVLEARRAGLPVLRRAEMLAELMRGKTAVGVSGTHGKTTTSSMLGTILTRAGKDPTLVIGGKVDSLGGNAKLGLSNLVVAEADESDGSFHFLPATYAIVTNVDADHLDHFGSIQAVEDAFVKFVAKLPAIGTAAVCLDDPGVRRCLPRFGRPVMTYGLQGKPDYLATILQIHGLETRFSVHHRPKLLGEVTLPVPGEHNVRNALGALVIALELGLSFEEVAKGLSTYGGVRRRFEVRWRSPTGTQLIVDDYAHHPTEIAATLASARAFWPGRIITVFQPHRYTRTRDCFNEFLRAFDQSDLVLLTDIYAADEDPIPGINSETLAQALSAQKNARYVGGLDAARSAVRAEFSDGDLVICMGAGSITRLAGELAQDIPRLA